MALTISKKIIPLSRRDGYNNLYNSSSFNGAVGGTGTISTANLAKLNSNNIFTCCNCFTDNINISGITISRLSGVCNTIYFDGNLAISGDLIAYYSGGTISASNPLGLPLASCTTIGGVMLSDHFTIDACGQLEIASGITGITINAQDVIDIVNDCSEIDAYNAERLDGQDSTYYTNITGRLGYTPVNKAGDTITGLLQLSNNADEQLRLGYGVTRVPYLSFYENTTLKAYIQYFSDDKLYIGNSNSGDDLTIGNTLEFNSNEVWHEGNSNKNNVNWTTYKLCAHGGATIDTGSNVRPLAIGRTDSDTEQVLNIGVTDNQAVFKYIEDTTSEGNGNFGYYQFILAGNDGETDEEKLRIEKTTTTIYNDLDVQGDLSIDSINIYNSTDRSGLLQIDNDSSSWAGIQTSSGGQRFSFMGDDEVVAIYNDTTPESWILRATAGAEVALYHAGNKKIETSSAGITIEGDLELTCSLRNQQITIARTDSGDDYCFQLYGGSSSDCQFFDIRDTKTGTPQTRLRICCDGTVRHYGSVVADTHYTSSDGSIVLSTFSTGAIYLQPDGCGSGTGQSSFSTTCACIGTNMRVNCTIYATDNITAYSDRRLKENIINVDDNLNKINNLEPIYYNRIGNNKKQIGLIAQDVEKIIPEIVITDDSEHHYKSIDYSRLSIINTGAIKELYDIIQDQQKKITVLENKLK